MPSMRQGDTEAGRQSGHRVSRWLRPSVASVVAAAFIGAAPRPPSPPAPPGPWPPGPLAPFSVVEATIAEMQTAMSAGRTTSHDIVLQSLTRIALYEDRLNAALAINPRALDEAAERDRERRAGKVRGPLHGV